MLLSHQSKYPIKYLFQNLKDDINLNSFLPSEITEIWAPELIFENTVRKKALYYEPFSMSFTMSFTMWSSLKIRRGENHFTMKPTKSKSFSRTLNFMEWVHNRTRVQLPIHLFVDYEENAVFRTFRV